MNCPKTVTASILIGILLLSTMMTIVPTTEAKFLNLSSLVRVSWAGNATEQPIVPRGALRTLELNVSYTVTRGAFGKLALFLYVGKQINVNLQILNTPDWCTASLQTLTMAFTVPADAGVVQTMFTTLSLAVSDQAPAYGLGSITIKASAVGAGLIAGYTAEFTLTFTPGYKPLISPSLPQTNTKAIGPMDTATFPIQIENLGNARTYVFLSVVDVPKDWTAVVTSQVILEEGAGSTATAYLVVKPPKNFGYHYDENTIRVSLQPARADDLTNKGEIIYETFLLQSRGFSTPGFEPILFLGALAAVLIIVKIKRKKT